MQSFCIQRQISVFSYKIRDICTRDLNLYYLLNERYLYFRKIDIFVFEIWIHVYVFEMKISVF